MPEYLGLGQAVRDTPRNVAASHDELQRYATRYGVVARRNEGYSTAGRKLETVVKPQEGGYTRADYDAQFHTAPWNVGDINAFYADVAGGKRGLSDAVRMQAGIVQGISNMTAQERKALDPRIGYLINDAIYSASTDYRRGGNLGSGIPAGIGGIDTRFQDQGIGGGLMGSGDTFLPMGSGAGVATDWMPIAIIGGLFLLIVMSGKRGK